MIPFVLDYDLDGSLQDRCHVLSLNAVDCIFGFLVDPAHVEFAAEADSL